MKKKTLVAAALASCFTISATFTGCSLISVISKADMEQVIATVDIREAKTFSSDNSLTAYSSALKPTSINKRNLLSYFLNVGYSYVSNGTSYKDTFNMLMDALIDNAVLVQYSTVAILEEKATNKDSKDYDASALSVYKDYNDKGQDVEKYEYLLGGEDSDDVKLAKYKLYSSINSAIDNYENTLTEEDEEYKGTATRTTPKNLNTEQDDYYPSKDGNLDYKLYTGYEGYLLKDSGAYQDDALDGTTRATRVQAYNTFIDNLRKNDLVDIDTEADKLKDITKLEYFKNEYIAQLESRVINKYNSLYEAKQEKILLQDNYIDEVYNELLNDQTDNYSSASAFESAMGNMSSTSFLLYSPDTSDSDKFDGEHYGKYGFVYNILLPFNAKQSAQLAELNSIKSADEDDDSYYNARNKLLKEIKTVDQRSAWFNGTDNYSFKASEAGKEAYGASDYLFFENNLTDSEEGGRYKKLEIYDGRYSYNGQVYENEDGSYTLIGNELTIDGMLEEFKAYVNYVLGGEYVSYDVTDNYYEEKSFKNEDDEIDYSKFLYANGKVDFGTFNRNDLMNTATKQYGAMSAVNELQFAYTTDTSVLSQYVGYSVQAYDTSYIKEFEYAAKLAISQGEGSFTVCAGDYGWHLIYVTYTFDKFETYSNLDWTNNVKVEGTFENLFFEWLKDKNLSDVTTTHRSKLLSDYRKAQRDSNKNNVTVVKYEKRYQDLLDLDNNNSSNNSSNNTTNNNNQ